MVLITEGRGGEGVIHSEIIDNISQTPYLNSNFSREISGNSTEETTKKIACLFIICRSVLFMTFYDLYSPVKY